MNCEKVLLTTIKIVSFTTWNLHNDSWHFHAYQVCGQTCICLLFPSMADWSEMAVGSYINNCHKLRHAQETKGSVAHWLKEHILCY